MKKEIEKLEIGGNIIYGYYDNDNNNFIIYNENNPAVISSKGTKTWYNHGKIHREDGPAIIRSNGTKEWCIYGKVHNGNGPAIIRSDGTKEWWINGNNITIKVHQWLDERNLDLDNLCEEDKLALSFYMRSL